MVAFSFQPGFVDMIREGRKVQTIRSTKRCKPEPGMPGAWRAVAWMPLPPPPGARP